MRTLHSYEDFGRQVNAELVRHFLKELYVFLRNISLMKEFDKEKEAYLLLLAQLA